ncbi:DUF2127 domain-containing protein [Shewanella schlegeliana]|uniref:DUF2127 domain-containing protein n=1 Tax=Shewanella schlegeliana TaxID=190308 RepID=A0ABS1SYF1_9GAMM|nr:DUF2127 domain-containing protein [Shewanella schlegeliana]MBL4913571.1 DUF2127 domain-containing protein [Shewanella schlegeliana]MCL1108462.1 DUF2127 domain-containing protein [Shewanella schlegeliana]GIU28570.1 hypothetical protein TUM4433_16830 [Shewanella schlegeliana]
MSSVKKGLKAIALLEATKGLISVLVVFGLHKLAGQDIQLVVEELLRHSHLNPANHLVQEVITEAGKVTEANIMFVIAGALLYAAIRFIEAYGLWHSLVWTEWFALLSGGIYLPFEAYELFTKPNFITVAVLMINLVVVGYMYRVIKHHPDPRV